MDTVLAILTTILTTFLSMAVLNRIQFTRSLMATDPQ